MLSVWKWVMVWSEGELLLIVIFLEYKQSPLWTLLSIYTLPSFVHSLGLVIHTFFQRVCLNSGVVCTHIFTYESRFYSLYKRFLRNWWSLGNLDVQPVADPFLKNCLGFSYVLRYFLPQIVDKHFPQFPVAFIYLKFKVFVISAHFTLVRALAQFGVIINGKLSLDSNFDFVFVFSFPFGRYSSFWNFPIIVIFERYVTF